MAAVHASASKPRRRWIPIATKHVQDWCAWPTLRSRRRACRCRRGVSMRRVHSLALARELQVPRAQVEAVAERLRATRIRACRRGRTVDSRPSAAQAEGEISTPRCRCTSACWRCSLRTPWRSSSARTHLSDLLQQASRALAQGDLATGARLIAQVRGYDAGHVELPDGEARLGARRRAASPARGHATCVASGRNRRWRVIAPCWRLHPDDAAAKQGIERVATAFAQRAAREAADFDFTSATTSLRQARELAPNASAVKEATAINRARPAIAVTAGIGAACQRSAPVACRRCWSRRQLPKRVATGSRRRAKAPTTHLRAAQALAPDDKEVKRADSPFRSRDAGLFRGRTARQSPAPCASLL